MYLIFIAEAARIDGTKLRKHATFSICEKHGCQNMRTHCIAQKSEKANSDNGATKVVKKGDYPKSADSIEKSARDGGKGFARGKMKQR